MHWRRKTENEKEENIWKKKLLFLSRRIKAEKKREECVWSKKRFLTGENKSGKEKEGK